MGNILGRVTWTKTKKSCPNVENYRLFRLFQENVKRLSLSFSQKKKFLITSSSKIKQPTENLNRLRSRGEPNCGQVKRMFYF